MNIRRYRSELAIGEPIAEGDEEIPARHGWGRTEPEALAELAVLEECGGRDIGARRWNPPRWPAHNTWLCAVSSESLILA